MSFLRAENCISGTTTTGTGTVTLAACPSPPGGVDAFAAFTGQGLGTSVAIPITYTIIEYTDSTFTTAKQMEKGVGLITIGANVGATTIARTTPQATATGMNTTTPTYLTRAPSAISIGTAANTLVMIAPSAADLPAFTPYFESSAGDTVGVIPADLVGNGSGGQASGMLQSPTDNYVPFTWLVPMLVKRATVNVLSTPGTTNNGDARLYEISTTGRPGKLLYDFGLFGSSNASFNATGFVSTGAAGNGFWLQPGNYFLDITYTANSGGSTFIQCEGVGATLFAPIPPIGGRMGTISTGNLVLWAQATSATIGAAPDPANASGYSLMTGAASLTAGRFMFWFKSS